MDPWSAVARGVFGAGSGFRVGWRAAGGGGLISVLPGFSAGVGGAFVSAGGWAVGYHSMGFRQFADVS